MLRNTVPTGTFQILYNSFEDPLSRTPTLGKTPLRSSTKLNHTFCVTVHITAFVLAHWSELKQQLPVWRVVGNGAGLAA